jgi:protein phosphatase
VPAEFGDVVYAAAVADGMGGEAAGEVASRTALSLLVQLVLDTPDWIFRAGEAEVGEIIDRAARRFRAVNEAVVGEAARGRHLAGMGTTLTLTWSLGADLFVAHVGDSRAYLLRDGVLRRLTRDHTLAAEMTAAGGHFLEEAAVHRLRHVLTRVIGRTGKGEADVARVGLRDGDRLLVCTDGLTEMAAEPLIAAELGRDAPAAEVCRGLIGLALRGGGKDNVTVAVVGYHIPPGL